jgi:hypothetical protein|tara:strand:+ start:3231 stop:3467 length:237 start_codon:yes stop_codon:yes gene_type:complete
MPRRLRQLNNSELGTLAQKNKQLLQYDHSQRKFVLVTANTILGNAASTGDISDALVSRLEEEIDASNLQFDGLDGGSF